MTETKRCPYCGEEILATAKKCKHCKEWLEQASDSTTEKKEPQSQSAPAASKARYWLYAASALAIGVVVAIVIAVSGKSASKSGNDFSESEYWGDVVDADTTNQEVLEDVEDPEISEVRNLLSNANYTKYSNARFSFTISYPDCFVMGEEPQNGDGCAFSLKYGISFSVWGSNNDSDYYGEDIKEYFKKDDDRAKSTYHVQKDNWFVMSGDFDNEKIFYKKVVLMNDYTDRGSYVTFYLLFPKKFDKVLADFINYEAKNFNPIYEGSYSQNENEEDLIDPLENLQIQVQGQPKREELQSGYSRDQQMALLLLMLAAAANSEFGSGGSHEMEYPCRSCGMTFSNAADLRSHENAIHDY